MLPFYDKKIMDRSPIKYRLTKAVSALDPSLVFQHPTIAQKRFSNCLDILSTESPFVQKYS